MLTRIFLAIALISGLAFEPGCSKTTTVSTPGALNSFDANAYQTLHIVQDMLNGGKQLLTPTTPPAVKTALNAAGAAYNVANDAYQAYHAALAAGGAPDAATLSAQIATLVTDITKVIVTLGGKPTPTPIAGK